MATITVHRDDFATVGAMLARKRDLYQSEIDFCKRSFEDVHADGFASNNALISHLEGRRDRFSAYFDELCETAENDDAKKVERRVEQTRGMYS